MSSTSSPSSPSPSRHWIPLESNPELLNKYLDSIGVKSTKYQFTDVYGTDEELLSMVPQPVIALLLLFPHSEKQVQHAEEEEKSLSLTLGSTSAPPPFPFHITQTIGNACGTIGLLHSILNNISSFDFDTKGFAWNYFEKSKDLTCGERGKLLESSDELEVKHQSIATDVSATSDSSHSINENLHFICFICHEDILYELDGMKKRPIPHGKTNPNDLLKDAVEIVKKFMMRDVGDLRFNMMALANSEN